MIKTESKTFCDCCGEEINYAFNNGEDHHLITLKYEVRYGGIYVIKDTCNKCNNKLFEFLKTNKMLQYVRESESK